MKEQDSGSRQAWYFRSLIQDYLIVRGPDLLSEEVEDKAAPVNIQADLDRCSSSLSTRRLIRELYEAVTGFSLDHGLTCSRDPREGSSEHVRRRLVEAFRGGELIALKKGPARLKKTSGGDQKGASPPAAPIPLLVDEPAKKPGRKEDMAKKEQTWVAFELVDEKGHPVPGISYRLTLPDGSVKAGKLDAQGLARIEHIPQGQCMISFPELDASAWTSL